MPPAAQGHVPQAGRTGDFVIGMVFADVPGGRDEVHVTTPVYVWVPFALARRRRLTEQDQVRVQAAESNSSRDDRSFFGEYRGA